MPSPPLDHAAIVVPSALVNGGLGHAPSVPAGVWQMGRYRRTETGAGVARRCLRPRVVRHRRHPSTPAVGDTRGADVPISRRDRGRITQPSDLYRAVDVR